MSTVSRSSKSVDDALQICHTTAKEVRANATELTSRLASLERSHMELQHQVDAATNELSKIAGQLSAAPKLADTPRTIADLKRLVADLGSQVGNCLIIPYQAFVVFCWALAQQNTTKAEFI